MARLQSSPSGVVASLSPPTHPAAFRGCAPCVRFHGVRLFRGPSPCLQVFSKAPASRTSHRRDTRRYISASSRSVMPHPMHGCCVGGWFGWTDTTASVWNLLWAYYLLCARNKFPALALHTRASLRTCFLVSGHSCCCWPGIAARRMVRYS